MEDSLLSEWWKNSGDYFASDLKLGDVDVNGNPYKWENEKELHKQTPAWEDFKKVCIEDAKGDLMYCLSNLDDSCENKAVSLCEMIGKFCTIADNYYEVWERND